MPRLERGHISIEDRSLNGFPLESILTSTEFSPATLAALTAPILPSRPLADAVPSCPPHSWRLDQDGTGVCTKCTAPYQRTVSEKGFNNRDASRRGAEALKATNARRRAELNGEHPRQALDSTVKLI